jgi:chaperonin cofactor prefoldin
LGHLKEQHETLAA